MKRLGLVTFVAEMAAVLCVSQAATAAEHVVAQKKMQFQVNGAKVETLTIKVGDSIVFPNEDTVAHNVSSRTPGFEFDLKSLRPGATGRHTFAKAGTVKIECPLHPRMNFKLVVEP